MRLQALWRGSLLLTAFRQVIAKHLLGSSDNISVYNVSDRLNANPLLSNITFLLLEVSSSCI